MASKVPASQMSQLNQIKELLLNTTVSTSILSVSERIFAVEGITAIYFVIAILFLSKTKKIFYSN